MTNADTAEETLPTPKKNPIILYLGAIVTSFGVGFGANEYLHKNFGLTNGNENSTTNSVFNEEKMADITASSTEGTILRRWAYLEKGPFARVTVDQLTINFLPVGSEVKLTNGEAATCNSNDHLGTAVLALSQEFQLQDIQIDQKLHDLVGYKLTEHNPNGTCDQNPDQIWINRESLDRFSVDLSGVDYFYTKAKYVISTPKRNNEKEPK